MDLFELNPSHATSYSWPSSNVDPFLHTRWNSGCMCMYTDGYYLFHGDIKLLIELHKGTWLPLGGIMHCSCFKVFGLASTFI